jgi:hypothetical protein
LLFSLVDLDGFEDDFEEDLAEPEACFLEERFLDALGEDREEGFFSEVTEADLLEEAGTEFLESTEDADCLEEIAAADD